MREGLGFYVDGSGWLHRRNPVPKLLLLIWGVVAPFVFPPAYAFGLLVLAILLGLLAELGRPFLRALFIASALLTTSIIVINGFFFPGARDVLLAVGPFHLTREGLEFGLPIAARVVSAIALTLAFVMSTRPDDLMEALIDRGASPRFAFVVLSAIQTIPRMLDKASRILDAQRSRGLATEGRFAARARAIVPLLGPLVIGSLIDVRERSLALEARAFGSSHQRTAYREVPIGDVDRRLIAIGMLLFAALPLVIAGRLAGLIR